MENLCSAALEFQATMYSLPIRAEYNIHVETLALFSKISTSVARQVACLGSVRVWHHRSPCSETRLFLPSRVGVPHLSAFTPADHESGCHQNCAILCLSKR